MTLTERAPYHQIHPLQVFTDVGTALIAIDLFCQRFLVPGLVIAIVPPVLVSAALIREMTSSPTAAARSAATSAASCRGGCRRSVCSAGVSPSSRRGSTRPRS